jgi:hypothetical protein
MEIEIFPRGRDEKPLFVCIGVHVFPASKDLYIDE